jgi:UDP-N-acetylmuramoyl-tripeptide--D-alanyl-D-alanine ligase
MNPMSLAAVRSAVHGELHSSTADAAAVDSVVIDSRAAVPGSLFAALPGERVDGHDYAGQAMQRGAIAVLATRPLDVPCIVVPDVVAALGQLAAASLRELDGTVIGITGSAGKTSTKDILGAVLARTGETLVPEGSFNNEIGLPLTVLRAQATTRWLVLEMSARGVGHIAELCRIAPPRIAVVLNVGSAHLGEFGSREAIATAKGEIVAALPGDGVAVLNADDSYVLGMRSRTSARVVTFGLAAAAADVWADDVVLDDRGRARFTLHRSDGAAAVALAVIGAHAVPNALAVAAVAAEAGLDVDATATALSAARVRSHWRMEQRATRDGVLVINDAYNANPESMVAALAAVVAIARPSQGVRRRSWAVLGAMGELGDASADAHDRVGRAAADAVDGLVVVGSAAQGIADGARAAGMAGHAVHIVADVAEAVQLLRAECAAGDVVLVKASRAVGLERVAIEFAPQLLDGAA